ncbi:MAG: helix-hairpin-helix domain-containing protein [Nannocystaceae bacterium]
MDPQLRPALLLALVVLGALLLALAPTLPQVLGRRAPPLVRVGVGCAHAVEVDGVLRCDRAAPRHLAELCGDEAAQSSAAIRSGDALRSASVCAANPKTRGGDWGRMAAEDLQALELPTNVNEAAPEELASLPRIGPVLAARIVAARPFASVAELARVRGIGPKTLAKLRRRARTSW